jgi:hypothetical protein
MTDDAEAAEAEPTMRQRGRQWAKAFRVQAPYTVTDSVGQLFAEREELTGLLTMAGIIEIAVRNPNVKDYMDHWEGRAATAETRCAALEADLAAHKSALRGLIPLAENYSDLLGPPTPEGLDLITRAIATAKALLGEGK